MMRSMRPFLPRVEQQEAESHRRRDELGGHEEEPRLREREAQRREHRRHDRGQLHGREEAHAVQAERAPGLEQLPVDVPQRGRHDRVDGEERADRDEDDLRLLADLEPQDQQRHPGERRHGADGAQRRREQDVAEAAEADDRAEGKADRRTEREADEHALRRDGDVLPEQAALGEVDGGEPHHLGRRQLRHRHQAARGHELPDEQQRDRDDRPAHDDEPPPTGEGHGCRGVVTPAARRRRDHRGAGAPGDDRRAVGRAGGRPRRVDERFGRGIRVGHGVSRRLS